MKEFDLIKRYFSEQITKRKDVILGIGDDCAILKNHSSQNIAITTDTLVCGVHFPESTAAKAIGHKAVAVNLSDLAAMGAEPAWVSLALTMPTVDEQWLKEFSEGFFELCEYSNVQLVGGDTTQGPLSITVTAHGFTPADKHITRSGAKPGDWIYVSADIGDPALALMHLQGQLTLPAEVLAKVQRKLDYPKPRILLGQALRDYASAAIDISDGLLADLSHICQKSNVGANIILDEIPLSNEMKAALGEKAIEVALTGGDDYEILFTVSETNKVAMETAVAQTGNKITCIGQVNHTNKLTTTMNETPIQINKKGFVHF
ncbi:MAG: thiamine-phosphate kinase [Thalassotalea sp.]